MLLEEMRYLWWKPEDLTTCSLCTNVPTPSEKNREGRGIFYRFFSVGVGPFFTQANHLASSPKKNQEREVQRLLQSWFKTTCIVFSNNISAGHTSLRQVYRRIILWLLHKFSNKFVFAVLFDCASRVEQQKFDIDSDVEPPHVPKLMHKLR